MPESSTSTDTSSPTTAFINIATGFIEATMVRLDEAAQGMHARAKRIVLKNLIIFVILPKKLICYNILFYFKENSILSLHYT